MTRYHRIDDMLQCTGGQPLCLLRLADDEEIQGCIGGHTGHPMKGTKTRLKAASLEPGLVVLRH